MSRERSERSGERESEEKRAGRVAERYRGPVATVIHCEGALESFQQALASVPAVKKRKSLTRQMALQIERLAAGQRMSREHFAPEADLPRRGGRRTGKFFALKRIPIRGYCWQSSADPSIWFISHYTVKKSTKLKKADIERVHRNWYRYEEDHER